MQTVFVVQTNGPFKEDENVYVNATREGAAKEALELAQNITAKATAEDFEEVRDHHGDLVLKWLGPKGNSITIMEVRVGA